jgi:Protein of unknown function (DUF2637)
VNRDRTRRGAMWAMASSVAAIAAIVSYSHIYALGRAHGGTGVAARLLPLSVDALILVGELMLLHEADSKGRRFVLGWVLVWSGILATLAANVTYGAAFGIVGAVIWGWPAYSFILAAAGMVAIVKRSASVSEVPGAVPSPLPNAAEAAAEESLRATLAAGNPWTVNALVTNFRLSRTEATKLRTRVLAEMNGQHSQDSGETPPDGN